MQKRTGISLIVLVITIIVMVILAGAIILTLNNSGIIDKATDAVEQTNLATVKQLTQMAWAEAYAGGERTEERLKAAVDKALSDNKVDTSKYVIEVTTSGVTVTKKGTVATAWRQEGLTVTNGVQTLEIGDYVDYISDAPITIFNEEYDEFGNYLGTVEETSTYEKEGGGWKILGASDDGELLIMSTKSVGGGYYDYSYNAYWNGVADLNSQCESFGKGTYAKGARAIDIQDVNKITGYNPRNVGVYDPAQEGQGIIYGDDTFLEYDNEITYKWIEDEEVAYGRYVEGVGTNGKSQQFSVDIFTLPNKSLKSTETATVTSNYYKYYCNTLTDQETGDSVGISTDSGAYKMLFRNEENTAYTGYTIATQITVPISDICRLYAIENRRST